MLAEAYMIRIESGTKFSELPVIAGRMGRYSTLGSFVTSSCAAPISNRMPNGFDNIRDVCMCISYVLNMCRGRNNVFLC